MQKPKGQIQAMFGCQENTDWNEKILGCLIEFLRD